MINAVKMRTCLLLLCYLRFILEITANTVITPHCPTSCSCALNQIVVILEIDCQKRTYVDNKQLSDELDSMLSSNLMYGRLLSLSIVNSSLTHVPRSICRLTTLTELRLDNNRLTRLPDKCLANLSNLERFTASDNAIETLQDGVFDGLTKLQYLDLRGNRISCIGLSVFTTSSNLSNLFYIDLSENNLTSLDTWIYDRGLVGSFERKVWIAIHHNKISKFTNKMGRHFAGEHGLCSARIPYFYIDIQYNRVRYFEDMLTGWELDFEGLLSCYRISNGILNFYVETRYNDIMCDCVNYKLYKRLSVLRSLQFRWGDIPCNLTDPLTENSIAVNGYDLDLILFVCELTERCPAECVCVYRPENATLHVYCSNKNLTSLPLELPELPDSRTKYKLDFSNNKLLRRLEYRDYFVNTLILDVSDCSVDDVRDWKEIIKMPEVSLSGNKISSLPHSFLSVNVTTGKLNLANNPWDCSCDNKWMSHCFSSIADRLTQKVLCYSPSRLRGKNIIQISDEEFCVDPASEAASEATRRALITSLSSVAGVVVVLLFVGVILYRLRVKLYTRWKFHPFDRDECAGEDMDYDVFLSCCSTDNLPDGNTIREQLEQRGYRVCYPPRDFLGGATITENICKAVVRSKRTVCLLTEDFCESSYCMYEFEVALHHNIMVKRKKRLIVLMALDNPNDLYANNASDTSTLRQYLRQYTYIDYKAGNWLDNLLYALPLHGMGEGNLAGAEQESADFNDTDAILLQ